MKIHWKKEIYLVSMDNASYSRINGEWHVNTGGNPLEWSKVNKNTSLSLENEFVKIQRKEKLKHIMS